MHIAILTFDGFNELDSFIASGILNRVKSPDWKVSIACPTESVTSMNGVEIKRQVSLDQVATADVVLVGSGLQTRDVVKDAEIIKHLSLDPARQLIGAQCSGALVLGKLGLLDGVPACTDLTTRPWVQNAGFDVLDQAFYANNNIATAGGCLASQYLAAWVLAKTHNLQTAMDAIYYVAPVGEKELYVDRMVSNIEPYL